MSDWTQLALGIAIYTVVMFLPAIGVLLRMFSYLWAAGVATRKVLDSRGYAALVGSAAIGVIVHGWQQNWDWDKPMEELGLFLTYSLAGIGFIVVLIYLWNLLRSPRLLSVLRASPQDLQVRYTHSDFGAIGLSAPYASFLFEVTNTTGLDFKFVDAESGFLVFIDVPWHDPWLLKLFDDEFLIPAGETTRFEVRQRVPPDLMTTIAGYRGRDDLPLSFADLIIPVVSEQIGPLKAEFNLHMPQGWHDISVPDRKFTGFGPKHGRFPFSEETASLGSPSTHPTSDEEHG